MFAVLRLRKSQEIVRSQRRLYCHTTPILPACLKLRAAAAIHPHAAPVIAPRRTLLAGRTADLADQYDSAARIRITIMAAAIVGRAAERPRSAAADGGTKTAAAPDLEVRAATAIHPYAPAVVAPRRSLLARRAAPLADHANSAARVGVAVVTASVVGRTGEALYRLGLRLVTSATAADLEIRAATAVHPHATAIVTPR